MIAQSIAQRCCTTRDTSYQYLAMALRPICEPVELPIGASVLAERVAIDARSPDVGRFIHFHDVAELVLFRRVRGEFISDGRRYRVGDGALTFVPSMRQHDFALGSEAMEWVLIQLDPYLVEAIGRKSGMARLARPFCAWPDPQQSARLEMLADWLVEAAGDPSNPEIEHIVELLLMSAAAAPEQQPAEEERIGASRFERLMPALERLRAEPAEPMALESAAAMCRMSTAYFSRRFKQVLGMNFSEYARVHRLHLAARRLATSGSAISEIAYGLGFSSPAHFSACFLRRFGMTPREYRNSASRRGN